jgi:acetyl esterase/lipase
MKNAHSSIGWLVLPCATALCQAPDAYAQDDQNGRLEGAEAIPFKRVGDVELRLFVFKPADWRAEDRRPAIVFFFGGGWRNGTPGQFAPHAKYLAGRGMVGLCAEYRVHSRHQAQVADCVADAKSAVRWVRGHAAELGVDPDRIVAAGGSAGGHLAAAVATLHGFDDPGDDQTIACRPNALALFNPAVDLTALGSNAGRNSARGDELRSRLGAAPEELSPGKHIVPGIPPTIIFHGRADTTVPYRQAEQFAAKMVECGNRCELAGYDGAAHGFFNHGRGDGSAYRDTLRRLDEFLASLGYLEGAPSAEAVK